MDKFLLAALTLVAIPPSAGSLAAADSGLAVLDIGTARQLFIDDYLIETMANVKRSFHPARKHPTPVMTPEYPWEGVGRTTFPSVYLFGDVMWDEDQQAYRMWYTTATVREGQHSVLYATSKDGINWHKPLDLGIVPYEGSTANNILIQDSSVSTVLKREGEADAGKRYQLFAYDRNVNAYAWRYSADGIHWGEPVPIPALKGMWDWGNVGYDEARGVYVLLVKAGHSPSYVHPVLGKHPQVNFRQWYMTTSRDGLEWTPLVEMLGDFDAIDKTLYMDGERCAMLNTYGISLFPYHGVYIGLQWMFRIIDAAGYWNCNGGPMDGRLLLAREWEKPWQIPTREFMLPRGAKGDWDWGMICGIANRPVLSPDGREWWYYYGGWDGGHGISTRRACIGLAKFRVDGFASIDTFGTEGFLTTKPLTFAGTKLKLNVNSSGQDTEGNDDYVKVELLDADGRVLDGFARDDCDPIHVDSVDHVVTWNGNSDVSALAGRVIRVKLYMKRSELYALQFVE